MAPAPKFDIHVFDAKLGRTLYAQTYQGFASEGDAKTAYIAANPHRSVDEVTVTRRVSA